ncbi:hypothetical protein ACWF94_07545 [Streptomyces sp. NPDC055078]
MRERHGPDRDPEGPVPRDPPDQQSREHEDGDPLDVPRTPSSGEAADRSLPDTDQSGAGRSGEPRSGSVHPEQPVPDEPSG